jgi:ElaB/YqjD/DUF883 family membrane-anchored ribosome-binding protein
MKNSSYATHAPSDILDDLRLLVADAETMVAASVTENSDDVVKALRARYDAVQARLAEVFDGARQTVTAKAKAADDTIRGNLYSSLAVAAVAGVFVGVLLARRGSR